MPLSVITLGIDFVMHGPIHFINDFFICIRGIAEKYVTNEE